MNLFEPHLGQTGHARRGSPMFDNKF